MRGQRRAIKPCTRRMRPIAINASWYQTGMAKAPDVRRPAGSATVDSPGAERHSSFVGWVERSGPTRCPAVTGYAKGQDEREPACVRRRRTHPTGLEGFFWREAPGAMRYTSCVGWVKRSGPTRCPTTADDTTAPKHRRRSPGRTHPAPGSATGFSGRGAPGVNSYSYSTSP